VLTRSLLAQEPGFGVYSVACRHDHAGWSPVEAVHDYRLVFVARGGFGRVADGTPADLDRSTAYLAVPGEEERFSHPAGGDHCLALRVSPRTWRTLSERAPRTGRTVVYAGTPLDLARRRLLAATRSGDVDYAVAECVLDAVHTVAELPRTGTGDPPAARLARLARDAVLAGAPEAASLVTLARHLHVSPSWLSRQFARATGESLTRYRNKVRVAAALEGIAAGETDLAALAQRLRFADQAHLTRTVRAQLGHTPRRLRRILTHR
jgi:AraC-like DNA-binding protein